MGALVLGQWEARNRSLGKMVEPAVLISSIKVEHWSMKRTRYLQSLQPKSSELSRRPRGENSKQNSSSSEKTNLKNSETQKINNSIPTRKRFFLRRIMRFDDLEYFFLKNFRIGIIFDGILEFLYILKNSFSPTIEQKISQDLFF